MHEDHELTSAEAQFAERAAAALRSPEVVGPQFDAQVMTDVRQIGTSGIGSWTWLTRPRTVRVSPLVMVGASAALLFLALLPWFRVRQVQPGAHPRENVAQAVQFVFYAPDAASVMLVGDFNDWDRTATPLLNSNGSGVWSVAVPLSPGRYQYAFVVDGKWSSDPEAARGVTDDFGEPNSVLTIAGRL